MHGGNDDGDGDGSNSGANAGYGRSLLFLSYHRAAIVEDTAHTKHAARGVVKRQHGVQNIVPIDTFIQSKAKAKAKATPKVVTEESEGRVVMVLLLLLLLLLL